jgi:hypothetical protein
MVKTFPAARTTHLVLTSLPAKKPLLRGQLHGGNRHRLQSRK